jgi:long-chain acyl-CoA synthetase
VLAPQMDALTLLRFWKPVVRHAVNTLWIVPTALASLLRCDRDAGGAEYCRRCIRTVCVGTAPLQTATKLAFEERYGVELLESYGLSELLFISSNATAFARKPGSVGRVLPGVEVAFGAADGDGAIGGEIRVRTPWLMDGYLDEQTSRPLRPSGDGWFPTGDLGVLDEDGDLFITGRIKDLIVRGGFNVSPRAVEAVLLSHEAVDQAAVVGVPHEFYGEEVTAALVLRDGRSLAADRPGIEAFCRGRLSAHAVPTRYVELDALPANAQGKILKRDLRARLSALAASSHA